MEEVFIRTSKNAKVRVCASCNQQATLYCNADAAFLCFDCDTKVHTANFLVARHVRRFLCSDCSSVTDNLFSGCRSFRRLRISCSSCTTEMMFSAEDSDAISCSSSSSCISTTQESQKRAKTAASCCSSGEWRRRRSREEEEEIFVNWCRRLGLKAGDMVARRASGAWRWMIGWSKGRMGVRVSLAASFWLGVRFSGDKCLWTMQNLKKVEEFSGVPAKLIVAVELKLENMLRSRRRPGVQLEEGWAES